MKHYWVASVVSKEVSFDDLRKKGFVVLNPVVENYVFLEEAEANKPLLRQQTALNIRFLRCGNQMRLAVVTSDEVRVFRETSFGSGDVVGDIEVVAGYCSGLDGRIVSEKDGVYCCMLKGWRQEYEVFLDRGEFRLKSGQGIDEEEGFEDEILS